MWFKLNIFRESYRRTFVKRKHFKESNVIFLQSYQVFQVNFDSQIESLTFRPAELSHWIFNHRLSEQLSTFVASCMYIHAYASFDVRTAIRWGIKGAGRVCVCAREGCATPSFQRARGLGVFAVWDIRLYFASRAVLQKASVQPARLLLTRQEGC